MSNWFPDYLETWRHNDVEAVTAWFTDDIVYEDVTLGHEAKGKDQVRSFVAASFKNVPDAYFDFVDGATTGDTYWMEWIMQPMNVRGVSVGSRRGDKICRNRDYWNGAAFTIDTGS
jgi:limonene-1,2-epoxide hydrolase